MKTVPKFCKDLCRKLGVKTFQDFLYFLAIILFVGYLGIVGFLSFAHNSNPQFVYYHSFILFRSHIQLPWLMMLCIGIMGIVFIDWLIMGIAKFFDKPLPSKATDSFESLSVSILVPAHNEEKVIATILRDLFQQSYKNKEIIVIAHNCTDKTAEIARQTAVLNDQNITVVEYYTNQSSKALALNKGLEVAQGFIIANFDADNRIPDKDFLVKLVQYFRNINIDGVQVSLGITNHKDDLLTVLQRLEFETFIDIFWRGRRALGMTSFLAGTGTAIRANLLRKYGGWDSSSLVEDFALFTKLAFNRIKIIYVDGLITLDEKPVTWTSLIKQRTRWMKGSLIISIKKITQFDNLVDYLYRLFPIALLAWTTSIFLSFYYSLSGQVSMIHISQWVWIGWTVILLIFLFSSFWPKRKWHSLYLVPLYWLFTYHLIFVALGSFFVSGWSHTKHLGKEA